MSHVSCGSETKCNAGNYDDKCVHVNMYFNTNV